MTIKKSSEINKEIVNLQDLARSIKKIKSIMRKDAGLSTDLERIPLLSWLLFLKWLDNWEIEQSKKAVERKSAYISIIKEKYRWKDWFDSFKNSSDNSILIFINEELLPYLASLKSKQEEDPHDIISLIFKEIRNPIESSTLFRQIVLEINKIDFSVLEQVHNLAYIYETLLKGMRDAAGNSGEFYTPRPVIRFIVEQLDPELGESILDPAVGTGGFLVESMKFLAKKAEISDFDVDKKINSSLFGIEKKSLPYLLCLMNLILHSKPNRTLLKAITRGNALNDPIDNLNESIDIIMTNPPFGGEEEEFIVDNFPEKGRTAETAILFVQYIMKRLKPDGRCALIVPNGFLFGDGAAKYVKEQLMKNFDLHHIILLPEGVFAPYTTIPTNILFFDKGKPTQEIHYIQVPSSDLGKKYSKTNPISSKNFIGVRKIWNNREITNLSWIVPAEIIHNNGYDLSPQNPIHFTLLQKSNYKKIINEVGTLIKDLTNHLEDLQQTIFTPNKEDWEIKKLKNLIIEVSNERRELVNPSKDYTFLGISGESKGPFLKKSINGTEIKANNVYRVEKNDLVYNRLFAWKGSFAHIPEKMNNCYVSNEFPIFEPKEDWVSSEFLSFYMSHPIFWAEVENKSRGSTPGSRNRLHQKKFLELTVPIPKKLKRKEIEYKVRELLNLRNKFKELRFLFNQVLDDLPKQMVLEVFKKNSK